MFERVFQFEKNRTSLRTEVLAGLTTFAAMAYILAVNPAVLAAGGMEFGAVLTATALASAIMTAVMGLATNYPIALAPGMGMNAFFAYTVCVGMNIPWQAALGMVFVSGFLFLLMTLTGVRRQLILIIPTNLKIAISCGIGLFIALIGLRNAGIVVSDENTLLKAGDLSSPPALLAFFGIILTAILVQKKIRGAIIIAIFILTLIGLFLPGSEPETALTQMPETAVALPASLAPTFLQLDVGYVFRHWQSAIPIVLAFLFVDVFDNMGTLIGVTQRAGLLDEKGELPRLGRALTADATAAMAGSCLGTSTVTSYIESSAGVEEGGRTGLTALVVAGCFLLALFFHPLIRIVPAAATAPALVVVGLFMMQSISALDLKDFSSAVPALLIIIMMPLTFSISEGLAIGFVSYALFMAGIGKARSVHWLAWVLAGVFLLHLLFGK